MTTETETPESFDLAAWLTDAKLPERSATVYQRGDLVGAITDLERRIMHEKQDDEPGLGGSESVRRYRSLVAEFEASALTVYVQAMSADRQKQIVEGLGKDASKNDVGAATVAAAVVAVQTVDGPRVPVSFTAADIVALEGAVGEVQMSQINAAFIQACRSLPTVDADFLQKFFGRESGGE